MKKYLLVLLSLAVITACRQGAGKGASAPKEDGQAKVETTQEKPMGFVSSLQRGPSGDYESIKITGMRGDEEVWSQDIDLYAPMSTDDVRDVNWLSYRDINFDGYDDLIVYLGMNAVGRVEEFYGAFLQHPGQNPQYVKAFGEIPNPEVDAEAQEITGTTRTSYLDYTTFTYKWQDGELVETSSKSEIFLEDDEVVSMALDYYHSFEEADGVSINHWAWVDIDDDGFNELWLSDDDIQDGALISLKGGFSMLGFTDYKIHPAFSKAGLMLSGPCGGPCYWNDLIKMSESTKVSRLYFAAVYGEVEEYNLDGKEVSEEVAEAIIKEFREGQYDPIVQWHVF